MKRRSKGASYVVTGGGQQANHARATAILTRELGMPARLLLRTAAPSAPIGNLLLDGLSAPRRAASRPSNTAAVGLVAESGHGAGSGTGRSRLVNASSSSRSAETRALSLARSCFSPGSRARS